MSLPISSVNNHSSSQQGQDIFQLTACLEAIQLDDISREEIEILEHFQGLTNYHHHLLAHRRDYFIVGHRINPVVCPDKNSLKKLPDELIFNIFSYLNQEAKEDFRSICSHVRSINNEYTTSLSFHLPICNKDKKGMPSTIMINRIQRCKNLQKIVFSAPFYNGHILHRENSELLAPLFAFLTPERLENITSIELQKLSGTQEQFDWDAWRMFRHPKLRELKISGVGFPPVIDTSVVDAILTHSPDLESFTMQDFKVILKSPLFYQMAPILN